MEPGIIVIYGLITGLSLILLLVTGLSYRKYKNAKLLFVFFVFLLLFIRGAVLSLSLFNEPLAQITSTGYLWGVDVIVLALLYVAYTLKR